MEPSSVLSMFDIIILTIEQEVLLCKHPANV